MLCVCVCVYVVCVLCRVRIGTHLRPGGRRFARCAGMGDVLRGRPGRRVGLRLEASHLGHLGDFGCGRRRGASGGLRIGGCGRRHATLEVQLVHQNISLAEPSLG